MVCIILLSGCASTQSTDRAVLLRQSLLSAESCSFHARITADYGSVVYQFALACAVDKNGDIKFSVVEPDSIAGITGSIHGDSGQLHFDDQVLGFSLLVDEQFSPVSAPWILMKTLRGGFIHTVKQTERGTYVCIDDSFDDDALQLDIWLDEKNNPIEAEILWKSRRILSIQITDFALL